jgi:hypothetical protein
VSIWLPVDRFANDVEISHHRSHACIASNVVAEALTCVLTDHRTPSIGPKPFQIAAQAFSFAARLLRRGGCRRLQACLALVANNSNATPFASMPSAVRMIITTATVPATMVSASVIAAVPRAGLASAFRQACWPSLASLRRAPPRPRVVSARPGVEVVRSSRAS